MRQEQRCLDTPNELVKLQPSDARDPTDSAGGDADEGFLPAADHATLQCHPSG